MRRVELAPLTDQVVMMEKVYGRFDIGFDGFPTDAWKGRNLKLFRPPEVLKHVYFPEAYVKRTLVNRQMFDAIGRVYQDIVGRWNAQAREAYGLNQFVKCYCFGDGSVPSLFWYGAAWELSPVVNGEALDQVIDLFKQHGFKHDRKRLRVFEYW